MDVTCNNIFDNDRATQLSCCFAFFFLLKQIVVIPINNLFHFLLFLDNIMWGLGTLPDGK